MVSGSRQFEKCKKPYVVVFCIIWFNQHANTCFRSFDNWHKSDDIVHETRQHCSRNTTTLYMKHDYKWFVACFVQRRANYRKLLFIFNYILLIGVNWAPQLYLYMPVRFYLQIGKKTAKARGRWNLQV